MIGNRIAVETFQSRPQTNQPQGEHGDSQKHKYSSSGDPECLYKRADQYMLMFHYIIGHHVLQVVLDGE